MNNFYESQSLIKMENSNLKEGLDPRTKIIILFLINITAFSTTSDLHEILVLSTIGLCLIFEKKYESLIKAALFYGITIAMFPLLMQLGSTLGAMISIIYIMIRKMFPVMMFASYMVGTTQVGEIVCALQKMKMGKSVIIPFVITIRFFPTIKEEFRAINDGMKMRGLGISLKNYILHPHKVLENHLVPMMIRLSIVADELSAAVITRGIESNRTRTSYYEVKFTWADRVFMLIFMLISLYVFMTR